MKLNLKFIWYQVLKQHDIGQEMYRLVSDLYPICRSITGNGFRETLNIIDYISLEVHEVPTELKYLIGLCQKSGTYKTHTLKLKRRRIVDFKKFNLHVVNYSACKQVDAFRGIKTHLFTLPDYPDRIPYRTSYYKESWGFLSHQQFFALKDEEYKSASILL